MPFPTPDPSPAALSMLARLRVHRPRLAGRDGRTARASTIDADRRQMATYLETHGGTHGAPLREALGWDSSRFWDAVYGVEGGWFGITPDGWDVTGRGRAEGLSSPPG